MSLLSIARSEESQTASFHVAALVAPVPILVHMPLDHGLLAGKCTGRARNGFATTKQIRDRSEAYGHGPVVYCCVVTFAGGAQKAGSSRQS